MNATKPRIVVGIDGSTCSAEALQWALRIANTTDATIDAVIAWHLPNMYGVGYLPGDYDPASDAEKILTEAVDAAVGLTRPADMRLIVKQGIPAKVLLDESEGAQMLVVGSRGHGGFAGLLLGSVSAACAEHARCPVLVVHGENDSATEATT
jgi:nucleotide-binding universal stress UspA family protein